MTRLEFLENLSPPKKKLKNYSDQEIIYHLETLRLNKISAIKPRLKNKK